MTQPGLTFRTLDPETASTEELDGWLQAIRRGFHEGRASEEGRQRWLEHVRADRVTLRGAWAEPTAYDDGRLPVATFSTWDKTLNVGGGRTLPLHQISDVTVAPTHRRRGLLRTLMTTDLAEAAAAGLPLAALTVSEGAIYGRFGFGPATFIRHLEVDVTARFALREPLADDGTLVLLEPDRAWPAVSAVARRVHAQRRGSVEHPQFYETWLSSRWDFDADAKDTEQRTVIHLDAAGEPDAYAVYKVSEDTDAAGLRWARVVDLVAATPVAYLAVWRFLASLDLVHRVRWRKGPVEDPLFWALVEPFCAKTTQVEEFLWVRVLDVPVALGARPWGADGSVVLEVDDPLGHAAGCWRVTTSAGTAEVVRHEGPADVRLSADTLGALYLGGTEVATLAAAGRVTGGPDAVARFAAMATTGPAPYCTTGF